MPQSLLHSGCQDLAVLVWAQLRLLFDGTAGPTNYLALAAELGLDAGTPKAVEVRFSRAVAPLIGTWILRERLTETQFTYRAVVPAGNAGRFAIVGRDVLKMMAATRHTTKVKPADIVDFARWQLECGQRGWTADTTKAIAERWNVTPATVRASRNRLVSLRLLEVVPRGSRLSDVVWLKELYDPYWMVPTKVSDEPREPVEDGTESANLPGLGVEQKVLGPRAESARSAEQKVLTPIRNLTESLSDDLSELGGTSVPTLTWLPRDLVDAPPPASSSGEHITGVERADHRHTAANLIGRHRVLAAAKPHFRTAMVKRLTAALEQGLAPGHADRALVLVTEEGAFDAECLLLERALQQAWIDQRVGMCADCGDRDRHSPGCSQFDFSWADCTTTGGHRDDAPDSRSPRRMAASDPIAPLLQRPVADDPDQLSSDAEIVDWMTVQLARQIAEASDRAAMLRTVWARWRSKLKPEQRQLLDRASEHVHYALDLRRVS